MRRTPLGLDRLHVPAGLGHFPAVSGSESRSAGRWYANPTAFLMDEPLSNLDAKLRVTMRAELATPPRALGRNHRVRDPRSDRGDDLGPAGGGAAATECCSSAIPRRRCSDRPVNLFVVVFIGSPAMNLVQAEIADTTARFAGYSIWRCHRTRPWPARRDR